MGGNAEVIQRVVTTVGNAASMAFPPSSAILTAFAYVMNASKAVSDDYDMLAAFFDIMNSFLERLGILESKMPSHRNYKVVMVRVFASILALCSIARKYRQKGAHSQRA